LRQDLVAEDLILLLIANTAILHVTRDDAPAASRRWVGLFLDAVRTGGPAGNLPEAPSPEELRRAMARMARSRGCALPSEEGVNRSA
jgi:hypothetical protein